MSETQTSGKPSEDTRPGSTPPFADAGVSEVIARVTYQLIVLDHRRNPGRYRVPIVGMRALSYELQFYQDTFLHTALAGARAWVESRQGKLKTWRDGIIYRSRFYMASRRAGKPWARCRTPVLLTGGSSQGHLEAITGDAVIEPDKSTRRGGRNAH